MEKLDTGQQISKYQGQYIPVEQWFSLWMPLPPRGNWQRLEIFLIVTTRARCY